MFHPLMTTLLFLLFFTTSSFSATNNTINIDHLSLLAKQENKHLLLFFHKYGCGFCEKMIDSTLDDESIEEIIDKYFLFVDIGIDDEGSILHHDFNGSKHGYAKSLEIGFYPTVGFLDGNNSMVYGVIGYRDIETFSILLRYIYSGEYKVMEWEDFKSKVEFEREE
ncbi:MAG: thioredoxin fold domain-containing protein [Sulfurovum sp.]|uniref:thioredoxin family protein n=1 Tax=Sulfurovum sp. TaxID=1969726 RepID=UPI0028681A88|nr:thioredoxin fold domain-containing protein [Sulfurovum sp.]MCO4845620.1 thioredoxin fold domain-containing protein [Sulfurovum sp.]